MVFHKHLASSFPATLHMTDTWNETLGCQFGTIVFLQISLIWSCGLVGAPGAQQTQPTKMWLWPGAKIHWEIAGCVPKADDSAWIFDELHKCKGWNSRCWMFLEAEGVKRQENYRKYKPKKSSNMYELLGRNMIFWGQSVDGGCRTQPCPINKQVQSLPIEVQNMSLIQILVGSLSGSVAFQWWSPERSRRFNSVWVRGICNKSKGTESKNPFCIVRVPTWVYDNLIWFNRLCIWSLLYAVSCLHQQSLGFCINILSVFRFLLGVLSSASAAPLIFSLRRRKWGPNCTAQASVSTSVPRFLSKAVWYGLTLGFFGWDFETILSVGADWMEFASIFAGNCEEQELLCHLSCGLLEDLAGNLKCHQTIAFEVRKNRKHPGFKKTLIF